MGTGFALRVTIDLSGLPDPVKDAVNTAYEPIAAASGGQLPAAFPYVIDQHFIQTLADMGAKSKASSLLGSGFRDFDQIAEVTEIGEQTVVTATQQLPSADLPVLDVTAGELIASIAEGPDVSADGTLARVGAQLDAVSALFPPELQAAFDDLTAAINDAVTTANGTLDTTLGDVATTLSETTDPVLGGLLDEAGLGDVVGSPTELTNELQSVLNIPTIGDILDGQLATVTGLSNDAHSVRSNGKVVSEATSRILGANALGLVKVGLVNLESRSEAAGVKGSADNTSECSVADVSVGGANGVALDGENLYVNGTAIPVPLGEVDAVLGPVKDVLDMAGISVETCDVAQAEADADGTSAAQRVSAFRIEIAPRAVADVAALGINAGDELVSIVIDPTVETAAASQVAVAETEDTPTLPRTGAAQLATILVGLGLAGGALVARKRLS
jgi:LPXTG-motif cell wall-anchored protein